MGLDLEGDWGIHPGQAVVTAALAQRELWCLGWGEHPAPLAPSLLLVTWAWVFLKAMQGLVTGHLQINKTFMATCHSLTLSTPFFLSVFSFLVLFSSLSSSYSTDRTNKCTHNFTFSNLCFDEGQTDTKWNLLICSFSIPVYISLTLCLHSNLCFKCIAAYRQHQRAGVTDALCFSGFLLFSLEEKK